MPDDKFRKDEEVNTQRRAGIINIDYYDTTQTPNKTLYPGIFTKEELYQLHVVPIFYDQSSLTLGITNQTSQTTLRQLRQKFIDKRIQFVLISDSGYRDYLKLYFPDKKVVYQDININSAGTDDLIKNVSATLEQIRADDMLAYLIEQAHKLGASDIHCEATTEGARVRFRIDGVLHPIAHLTIDKYRVLIAAIASAGNISTSSNEAQQGHIYEHVKMANGTEVDINIRLETTPTINGIDVVMRLFNMDSSMYTLDRLGLSQSERVVVDDIIHRPSGLVLIVGPTGSGKTTTLYSMLNSLNSEERKIITIEDPVEYQFTGISQIPVNSKSGQEVNFAEKLRAVLRLDPDVVMVGEIRDMDTAKTALQASLTGHLVLSTFHATSASAALTRLLDVIGQNPLFLSSIRLIMAQRLVRLLDDTLKQPYQPDQATFDHIKTVIDSLPPHIQKPDLNNLTLYNPGKSAENPFGYKGQIAIREQMLMTKEVIELLESQQASSTQVIEQTAIKSGMTSMLQDAILKVVAGETSFEEVYRVIG